MDERGVAEYGGKRVGAAENLAADGAFDDLPARVAEADVVDAGSDVNVDIAAWVIGRAGAMTRSVLFPPCAGGLSTSSSDMSTVLCRKRSRARGAGSRWTRG